MEYLTKAGDQYSIHKKGTDRAKRIYDGIEIEYVAQVEASEYDYIYETYGYHYGIQRSQIDEALATGKHHFIICNDIGVIRKLRDDYGEQVRVIFHHFDAPREALLEIQQSRNISDDEIELRLAKTEVLYRTFVEERALFDDVLHNHYGADPGTMVKEIERLLFDMSSRRNLNNLTRDIFDRVTEIASELRRNQVIQTTEIASPIEPGYVFVIMPMMSEIASLRDTYAAIVRACKAVKVRSSRIDDEIDYGTITERLHANIRFAKYVVADLTHERPNVYYEVGYANALDKPILLVASDKTNVHFDLQAYRIDRYHNFEELEDITKKWLRKLKKEHAQPEMKR